MCCSFRETDCKQSAAVEVHFYSGGIKIIPGGDEKESTVEKEN
jgi:hypothetical protein